MKKMISLLLCAVLIVSCLSACASEPAEPAADADGIQIVTTIFPVYDWVSNVLGENPADAEVTMLLDSGVDLHSYQPTADDILKISTCDLFLYVGGESDEWVENALKTALNPDMIVLNLLDILGDGVREEEVIEGMQAEEEAEEAEEEGPEYDEHVWLSLKNAAVFVGAVADALAQADPANAEVYAANAADYTAQLSALDAAYAETVGAAKGKTLLFGDRFPFRYLTEDYGLDYYAAFVGCSAETEASFETVLFLAQKVDELSLPAVLTIEGTDHRVAETIVQNTAAKNQPILTLDSMQSVTSADVEGGASYLSIMESNLSVLQDALQ